MNNLTSTIKFILVIACVLVIASVVGSNSTDSFLNIFVVVSLFFVGGNIVITGLDNESKEITIIAMAKKYHAENSN